MMYSKYEIVKVTEMRNNCIFRTQIIGAVWVTPYDDEATRKHFATRRGGDHLVPSSGNEYVFQKDRPPEEVYTTEVHVIA